MEGGICREDVEKQLDSEEMDIAFAHVEALEERIWLCKELGHTGVIETAKKLVPTENEGVEVRGVSKFSKKVDEEDETDIGDDVVPEIEHLEGLRPVAGEGCDAEVGEFVLAGGKRLETRKELRQTASCEEKIELEVAHFQAADIEVGSAGKKVVPLEEKIAEGKHGVWVVRIEFAGAFEVGDDVGCSVYAVPHDMSCIIAAFENITHCGHFVSCVF